MQLVKVFQVSQRESMPAANSEYMHFRTGTLNYLCYTVITYGKCHSESSGRQQRVHSLVRIRCQVMASRKQMSRQADRSSSRSRNCDRTSQAETGM